MSPAQRQFQEALPPRFDVQGVREPESAPAAPDVTPTIRVRRSDEDERGRHDLKILLGIGAVAGLGVLAAGLKTLVGALCFSVGAGCLVHLLSTRPLLLLARALRAKSARLRAAMTCPYCHDALPEDAAMGCERPGCGAVYHEECWAECHESYGGCAIYGCGSVTAQPVGRLALLRRVFRMFVAAILFPPRLVERMGSDERTSFRAVWRRSRGYQEEISNDARSSLEAGVLNMFLSVLAMVVLLTWVDSLPVFEAERWILPVVAILMALPVLLMRLPLGAHFSWAVTRLLARVFRDELAALRRADGGTVLARMGKSTGK